MRIALNVAAVLCLLVGCVWFLQGINVLPGSFMTGHIEWAYYGVAAVLAGAILVVTSRRPRRPS
jgi:hypothetical protein